MPQLLPAALAETAIAAAPAIAGEAALGASGLAALPSVVSPAVAGMASGLGAGALEAGLATGLGTMGGGLAALAPGVSAAASLLPEAVATAAPAITSSLAGVAPGVASTIGQAASGLGSAGLTGLESLAQTAGYGANLVPQVTGASQLAQIAPTATEIMTPVADAASYLPSGMTEAQYATGMQNIYGPTTSTDVMGNTVTRANTGNWGGIPSSSPIVKGKNWATNAINLIKNPSLQGAQDYIEEHPYASAMGAYGLYNMLKGEPEQPKNSPGMIRPYTFTRTQNPNAYAPSASTAERTYFNDTWTAGTPYKAPGPEYKAEGGLLGLAVGGPVEMMSAANAVGSNAMYPQANLQTADYSNPMVQRPMPSNVIKSGVDVSVDPYTGEQRFAGGGISNLGDYSDGGRLLKGPGDGVSDSIPAVIGDRQPARLADGEFVVPARIVSELGNGSTEAGARKLYSMMDRVQKARGKTTGKGRVAANTKADKYLPA